MAKDPRERTGCVVKTIGHPTHTLEAFIRLLQTHEVKQVGEVRMTPFARVNETHLVYPAGTS